MEGKTTLTFEVSSIPDEHFKKFGVDLKAPNALNLLLHELFCQALHEDNDEAYDILCDYVINVE